MVKELKEHGFDGDIVPWTRGVDRTIFSPSLGLKQNKTPVLVCVARVSKEKNLEDFLELDHPGRKIMVGDGPMLEEYKKQYPNVEFVGFKTGIDLADYYRMADVFVFPSRWETFGIVMIEAMACGTPVAAYPVQGPEDVVDEGITGCMNDNLKQAVKDAMMLDRHRVWEGSHRWSWERAWEIFRNNLVEKSGTR
jgi:glycosyltransferase involved in cell wall biosynthesis